MPVNGRHLTLRADGGFRVRRSFKLGNNRVTFTATDQWGNKASVSVDVVRLAP